MRPMLAILALLLITAQAYAEETATCAVPNRPLGIIDSTHTLMRYPTESQRRNEGGATGMTVDVGADGIPDNITVTRSSGAQRLDDAAVAHIKAHWRWMPKLENCKPAHEKVKVLAIWTPLTGFPPKADTGIVIAEAEYPPGAIERAEMGDAFLEISLGDGGVVSDGHLLHSSGYDDLDEKALAVIRAEPGLLASKPAGEHIVLARWRLPLTPGEEIIHIIGVRIRS